MTPGYSQPQRRRLAYRMLAAVTIFCFGAYFLGDIIFKIFNITLDAFRIGAGALLFLSAVELVRSKAPTTSNGNGDDDIAVVPLAMPIVVGPAVIGTLLVISADMDTSDKKLLGCAALATAIICLGVVLLLSSLIERLLGVKRIMVLVKFTGLILAALAAQMIFTGAANFLVPPVVTHS